MGGFPCVDLKPCPKTHTPMKRCSALIGFLRSFLLVSCSAIKRGSLPSPELVSAGGCNSPQGQQPTERVISTWIFTFGQELSCHASLMMLSLRFQSRIVKLTGLSSTTFWCPMEQVACWFCLKPRRRITSRCKNPPLARSLSAGKMGEGGIYG